MIHISIHTGPQIDFVPYPVLHHVADAEDVYPKAPAICCCEKDEVIRGKLAGLNEYYQEGSALPPLLSHVRVLRTGMSPCLLAYATAAAVIPKHWRKDYSKVKLRLLKCLGAAISDENLEHTVCLQAIAPRLCFHLSLTLATSNLLSPHDLPYRR